MSSNSSLEQASVKHGAQVNIIDQMRRDMTSKTFWLHRAMAHPCCWLPILSGGSLRLFDTHQFWIELAVGAAFVIGIEEAIRAYHNYKNRKCCSKGRHSSRLLSYAIATPLFLLSFWVAHIIFPHNSHHDHDHDHSATVIQTSSPSVEESPAMIDHGHSNDHSHDHHDHHDHYEQDNH